MKNSNIKPFPVTLYERAMFTATAMIAVFLLSVRLSLMAGTATRCQTHIEPGIRWTVDCTGMNLSTAPLPLSLHPVITLNLSHNHFEHLVESLFINWTDILHLDISFNKIYNIDSDSFRGLSNLNELNLMHNYLEVLSPNVTSHLPKLRVLNLSSNNLKTIFMDSFYYVPLLLRLYLKDNLVGKISKNLYALNLTLAQSLIHLDLANTSISEFPEDIFDYASHLIALNLAQNPLTIIPSLPLSLRHLNMSDTLIETIPQGKFTRCELLQRISLNGMPLLRKIEDNAFSGLTYLEELYISSCPKLSSISPAVFGDSSPKLRRVSMAQCALTSLPTALKDLLVKADYLDLQDNPWLCDGKVAWIAKVNFAVNLTSNLRCDQPPSARGMLLVDYFKPRSHPHSSLIRAAIVIAMIVILVASVVAMIRHTAKEKGKTYRHLQSITLQERTQNTSTQPL